MCNTQPTKKTDPLLYTKLICDILTDCTTRLKFDDYVSKPWTIHNGIGQGCPLLIIIYIIYNADLIEIPTGKSEHTLDYINNTNMMAIGDTFEENNKIIMVEGLTGCTTITQDLWCVN